MGVHAVDWMFLFWLLCHYTYLASPPLAAINSRAWLNIQSQCDAMIIEGRFERRLCQYQSCCSSIGWSSRLIRFGSTRWFMSFEVGEFRVRIVERLKRYIVDWLAESSSFVSLCCSKQTNFGSLAFFAQQWLKTAGMLKVFASRNATETASNSIRAVLHDMTHAGTLG